MSRSRIRLTLAVTLVALAAPATPAAAEVVYETYRVPTVGGAEIAVEVMRDTANPPGGVLLTYSPYNTLSETREGNLANDGYGQRLVPRGYVRAVADVLGTRNSSGCWDYGGAKEQQSGVDLVNFLAAQPWSNGNVGMIGGSYDGTTATMVAARGDDVPGLKAIVPIAAISHWYGYAYNNGVRYFLNSERATDEGFDTPLAFDFGLARTPPTDADDPKFAEKLGSRANPCEAVEHTMRGYDAKPDYDAFWRERSYRKDADEFRAATLIGHGWQDYNVKQEEATALWEALAGNDRIPLRRLFMTQGRHSGPSGPVWNDLLYRFLDRYLMGRDTGVEQTPPVHTAGRTITGDGYKPLPPTPEADWPPPGTTDRTFWIRRTFDNEIPGVTLPDPGTGETGVLADEPNTSEQNSRFTWFGAPVSEEVSLADPLNRPGAGHGYYSLSFTTPPLSEATRMAGEAVFDGFLRYAEDDAHFTPLLYDEAPDGTMRIVARGFLNLGYRDGLEEHKPAGRRWVPVRMRFLPQDFTFQPGHRIGLMLQSANTVWAVPGPTVQTQVATGAIPDVTKVGSKLILPLAPVAAG